MPKIAFVATNEWIEWGGSEFLWSEAAEKMAQLGCNVQVSVKDWGQPLKPVERLQAAGCHILYRRPLSLPSRIARKVLPLANPIDQHLREIARIVDFALVSQSSYWESLPWIDAVRRAKIPYAIVVQGASETLWPPDRDAERLALGFENAERAYFVSESNVGLFRKQLGLPLKNACVIRNPFHVNYEARPPWPAGQGDGLALACVARLDTVQKGQDLLLEVLRLPHWRERSLRITFAGSGPNDLSLRKLARAMELKSVDFVGHVGDVEPLWSQHHALVLPSRFEGMPISLVEAMLCGRPCIVTDVGGNRELVCDNVNGFIAKAPTVELLDEAMNRAWENRHRLREMGEQAATDVRRYVSSDPVGDFVRDLTGLVESKNGSSRA